MIRLERLALIMSGACALLFSGPTASAKSLRYELRFDDGSTTRYPAPRTHTLELYALVRGDDTDHTNDGMGFSFVTITSRQIAGGSVSGAIVDGKRLYPFDLEGRDGLGSDLNADGFGDWGSLTPSTSDAVYMFAHVAPSPLAYFTAADDIGRAVDKHTWEFPIATFTISVTDTLPGDGGETQLEIVRPTFSTSPFLPYYASFRRDGALLGVIGAAAGVYGAAVSFVVPEPSSAATLVAAMIFTMSGRRRRDVKPRGGQALRRKSSDSSSAACSPCSDPL